MEYGCSNGKVRVGTEDTVVEPSTDGLPSPLTAQAWEKTQISNHYTKEGMALPQKTPMTLQTGFEARGVKL